MSSKRKREKETPEIKTISQSEEISFPRGGGSLLTPLEIKQATNEASKELFADESSGSKTKKSKPPKKKKKLTPRNDGESSVRIESVNSHIVKSFPGTTVLSQIIRVGKTHLIVGLPNTLIGEISAENISEPISECLRRSDQDDDSADEDQPEFKSLQNYGFSPGQWLRVAAAETSGSRGLSLTCEPSVVNEVISDEDLTPGMLIQGYIKSIEDKGAIVDIGKSKSGFVSNKDSSAKTYVPGQVCLFEILSNSRTILLADASSSKKRKITGLDSVDSLISGTLVDLLVTSVEEDGIVGKIFGSVDATMDYLHSGFAYSYGKPQIGDRIKARIIYSQGKRGFNVDETAQSLMLVSRLANVVSLASNEQNSTAFKTGQVISNAKVSQIRAKLGVYVTVGEMTGFVHISRLSDNHVDSVEDAAPLGSLHQARVLDYSPIDNLFIMAFARSIVDQRYTNLRDIPIGETFRGVISGYTKDRGLFINLYNYNDNDNLDESEKKSRFKKATQGELKDVMRLRGVAGPLHISDVKLKNPELKYKLNSTIKCRVLDITENGSLRLTVKKSLVNSDDEIFEAWDDVILGSKIPGTIIKIKPVGAVIEFFGGITAFLPLSEMSEAVVEHPDKLFSIGQTVRVTVLKKQEEPQRRIIVTCRASTVQADFDDESMETLKEGKTVLEGTVIEKTVNGATLKFSGTNAIGVLAKGHICDDVNETRQKFKQLAVGDKIEVVILQENQKRRLVTVTAKEALIEEARSCGLLSSFQDIVDNGLSAKRYGFITNVTSAGFFVGFAGRLSGLMLKSEALEGKGKSNLNVLQTVKVHIFKIDKKNERFFLSMKDKKVEKSSAENKPGDIVKVVVNSIKPTQLNVKTDENKQGRIDISEIYDKFEDIENPGNPLARFQKRQELNAKIIGYHDVRSHKFLPISHRSGGHTVLELSLRPSVLENASLVPRKLNAGDNYLAFINNIDQSGVYVNISPEIKGRVSFFDLTNDVAKLSSVSSNFPIGTALSVTAKAVEPALKLTGTGVENSKNWENIKVGQLVVAQVIHPTANGVIFRLGDDLTASAYLTDLSDNYTNGLAETFIPQTILPAKITEIDISNKRVSLTLRKSEISDSSSIEDPVLHGPPTVGSIIRGFVRRVADAGLFIGLSSSIIARAQIKNLSDDFLDDWKKPFTVGQLVKGKILSVDENGRIELTLKASEIGEGPTGSSRLEDVEVGASYDGSIKRVEEFGVFVRLDGFNNISGLCHKSELADIPLHNLSKVFTVGDKVKVKVLKADVENGKLSLGMKASYFNEDVDMEDDEEDLMEDISSDENDLMDLEKDEETSESEDDDLDSDDETTEKTESNGLSAGFDWTASILDQMNPANGNVDSEDEESEDEEKPRKKRRKGPIAVEDKTATLTTKLPQSISDFERLLMGSPNSSVMWMNYMAFQLQLSEIDKARDIGERALKTIGLRHEDEKMNIWVALLNLENSFGTPDTIQETFKRSCQYMDAKEMHVKMATIYASSDKIDKAMEIYGIACKKFGREDPSLWVNYGQMLYKAGKPVEARELLDRALKMIQTLPTVHQVQRDIISKFAIMEFTSENGDQERGRTLFEGLVSSYPKRIDLWNIYLDQEMKTQNLDRVRQLFERVITNVTLSQKQAKFFFKKWLTYETQNGDIKSQDYVKAKAAEYVKKQSNV